MLEAEPNILNRDVPLLLSEIERLQPVEDPQRQLVHPDA
jgi:hypothetical protein